MYRKLEFNVLFFFPKKKKIVLFWFGLRIVPVAVQKKGTRKERNGYWGVLFEAQMVKWLLLFCGFLFVCFLTFWPHHVARGILVPGPGIKLMPPALEAQSLNHWTTREVPFTSINSFNLNKYSKR